MSHDAHLIDTRPKQKGMSEVLHMVTAREQKQGLQLFKPSKLCGHYWRQALTTCPICHAPCQMAKKLVSKFFLPVPSGSICWQS